MTDWKELYRRMQNVAAGYSNYCDESASTRKLEKEYEQVEADAREQEARCNCGPTCEDKRDGCRYREAQPAAQDWAAVETIPLSCPRCGEVLHVAQPAAQKPLQHTRSPFRNGWTSFQVHDADADEVERRLAAS